MTADDFLNNDLPVPEAVLETLREHVAPPDRDAGTRTVRGLLDPLLPPDPRRRSGGNRSRCKPGLSTSRSR